MYKLQTGKFKGELISNMTKQYLNKFYSYLHNIPKLNKNQREDFDEVCFELDRRDE